MKKKSSLWVWGILSIAVVLIVGIIDWFTGHELNFFVFYFLPVSVAAWVFGLIGSVVLATISATVWFGADYLGGHTHPSTVHAVWNTMNRLISFLAIGWVVARLNHLIDQERQTAETLRRSLSEIRVLEAFLPICAQCKKIRDEQGDWHQLEAYISKHTNTKFSHSCCPDCYKRALVDAGLLDK